MKVVSFSKMSGAGNDFVAIDNRRLIITDRAAFARRVCGRTEGVGADGLLLLERSRVANFKMRYYNADGTDGGMCGNGGRCMSWFAYLKKLVPARHTFEALERFYRAEILATERVLLHIPDPDAFRSVVQLGSKQFPRAAFLNTGSPHAVIRVRKPEMEKLDVVGVGRPIRSHRAFGPEGANVNFVYRYGPKRLRMRTYERGVEQETLACGTGSIACALIGSVVWRMRSPVRVRTSGGEDLVVRFVGGPGNWRNVSLEGSARVTFKGTIRV